MTAFGTAVGRFLIALSHSAVSGAYAAIIGVMEIIDITADYVFRLDRFHSIEWLTPVVHDWAVDITGQTRRLFIPDDAPEDVRRELRHSDRLLIWENGLSRGLLTVILGVFLFLLLHVPPFRRGVFAVLRWTGRGTACAGHRPALSDFSLAAAAAHLDSPAVAAISYYLLKPGLVAGLAWFLLWRAARRKAWTSGYR